LGKGSRGFTGGAEGVGFEPTAGCPAFDFESRNGY